MDCLNTTYTSACQALQDGYNWSCETANTAYTAAEPKLSEAKAYFFAICERIYTYVIEFFNNIFEQTQKPTESEYVFVGPDAITETQNGVETTSM